MRSATFRSKRSRHLLLSALLLWLLCAPGRAQLPVLVWEAPPACPDARAVREVMQRVVDPTRPGSVRAVRAQVADQGTEYRLDLALQTAGGEHRTQLYAEHCSTFVELLALELSLAAAPRAKPEPAHVEVTSAPIAWGARVSGTLGNGPTPAPAAGVALALALSWRRARAELAGAYTFRRSVHYPEPAQVGARLDMFGGEARGCLLLTPPRVEFPICAGVELGALGGSAVGVEQTAQRRQLWAALFVAPAARVPIAGPLSFWLELGVSLGLRRPGFGVQNLPALYRPELFGVRAATSIVLQFD
jgi:hypothetical protein